MRDLGIVSNCWKAQFDQGQRLEDLISEAERRGLRAVELRQGSLGEYETALPEAAMPASSVAARRRFRELAARFPSVKLNLAVNLPCFSSRMEGAADRLIAALHVASALATDGKPHVRLVDTETRDRSWDEAAVKAIGQAIAQLATPVIKVGGWLSVENAYQPWSVFWPAMQVARKNLRENASRLRCCFDPCNLLLTEPPGDVPGIVESMSPADVSMIHLKQRRDGQIQRDVSDGDLAWPILLDSLDRRNHSGPFLFEVTPDEKLWENIEQSVRFLFGSD
jgi:sugar phosphate isomerase/epimerase